MSDYQRHDADNTIPESEWLSAYLDDELPPEMRAALEMRLAEDPALQAELEALRQTMQWVRGLPALRAPRDFTLTAETVARLRSEPQERTPKPKKVVQLRNWFVPLASVAAILVIVVGLTFVLGDVLFDSSGADEATTIQERTEQTAVAMSAATATPLPTNRPLNLALTAAPGLDGAAVPRIENTSTSQPQAQAFMAQPPTSSAPANADMAERMDDDADAINIQPAAATLADIAEAESAELAEAAPAADIFAADEAADTAITKDDAARSLLPTDEPIFAVSAEHTSITINLHALAEQGGDQPITPPQPAITITAQDVQAFFVALLQFILESFQP